MAQAKTWVGLDVHAAKVVAAIVDTDSGELRVQRLPGRTAEAVRFCTGLAGPVRASYEAGPTGFGLARALEQAGVSCVIAAPGKIARPATARVKTDRRDAELLCGCRWPASSAPFACRAAPRRRCATSSARARTSAAT